MNIQLSLAEICLIQSLCKNNIKNASRFSPQRIDVICLEAKMECVQTALKVRCGEEYIGKAENPNPPPVKP